MTIMKYISDNAFVINREMLIQERWQAILRCKEDFLQNQIVDLCKHPYINREVADSWVRSKNKGVNPYAVVPSPNLSSEQLSEILDNHRLLIDTTNSLLKFYKDLLRSCGYIFCLFDKTGVMLSNEGDWKPLLPFYEQETRIGVIANENSEGTSAHELCIRLNRPVQLLGPEHYCLAFQNCIASAVPIKDGAGEILAALVLLSQPCKKTFREDTLKTLIPHSLFLAVSMAANIEAHLKIEATANTLRSSSEKLQRPYRQIKSVNEKTETVISLPQSNKYGSVASYTFENIISENKEMKKSIALAKRFADSAENILMIGESGTGKELYAQSIHNSYRPQGPFMAVNCAALPRELIESELFGYEGGSFTGAERSGRPGKIEMAHNGTLFLDEIGDMPLELQAVLLRTIEDKQIIRIGGSRYKKVDFRLVTATNKDLYKMVKENQFREDLYFRLSVLTINIPPLRERGSDIEILSKYFIENYCRKQNIKIPEISQAALKQMKSYSWPGNVRQLQNAMIYAANTASGNLIKPENLPSNIILETCSVKITENATSAEISSGALRLEKLEKAAIEAALLHANNYVPSAAEILGINRSTLYRKLKEYNINTK